MICADSKRAEVERVNHAVAVVVVVPHVGHAIVVPVEAAGAGGVDRRCADLDGGDDVVDRQLHIGGGQLDEVVEAVVVAVGLGGVQTPLLGTDGEVGDFKIVGQHVVVGVGGVRVGAEAALVQVGQAVAIGVQGAAALAALANQCAGGAGGLLQWGHQFGHFVGGGVGGFGEAQQFAEGGQAKFVFGVQV